MPEFFSILTNAGAAKLALAAQIGKPMAISAMAVGDGAGATPTPLPEQTELAGEQYRADLNSLSIASAAANVISAEMIIPPEFGGFWIREVGLYADDGVLVAVGNLPATYKPRLVEGSGRNSVIRVELAVSSTSDVQLLVDPNVVIATTGFVEELFRNALNRANDAYALAESRLTFDDAYPIGETKFFATAFNPNEKWPGTHWIQLAENKTIRTANAEGTNVMEVGGNDSINITRANLPAEEIAVTGDASEHDTGPLTTESYHFGHKETSPGGRHKHAGGMGAPGEVWDDDYIVGSDNDSHRTRNYTNEADDHVHYLELEDHEHTIKAIKHKHDISAKTDILGQGDRINIVNSYIVLAGWFRAA